MTAWRTLGQARAIAAIRADLGGHGSAHAYLFAGPPKVGKATLAAELAMALNCEATPAERPCHECRTCRRIAEGKHADVQSLSVDSPCDESNEREHDHAKRPATVIRMCQVHRLRRVSSEAAFEGGWRVFVVAPADLLNLESANALLKTLEEPPAQVVFVLVTSREEAIPETVRSRCRRIEFGAMPAAEIAAELEATFGTPSGEALEISRLARGRFGWAIAAAQPGGLDRRRATIADIVRLADASRVERFAYAADLAKTWTTDRPGIRETLEVWSEWWRDVMVAAAGHVELIAHAAERADVERLAAGVTTAVAAAVVETIRTTHGYLDENVNPRLALEAMMLALPARPGDTAEPPRATGAGRRS